MKCRRFRPVGPRGFTGASEGSNGHDRELSESNERRLLCEFIDRRSAQCEDRDSEGAADIMHSLRIGPDDCIRKPTSAQHDLLVVAQFISRPDETFLHTINASDRGSCRRLPSACHRSPRRARLRTANQSRRCGAPASASASRRSRCESAYDRPSGAE